MPQPELEPVSWVPVWSLTPLAHHPSFCIARGFVFIFIQKFSFPIIGFIFPLEATVGKWSCSKSLGKLLKSGIFNGSLEPFKKIPFHGCVMLCWAGKNYYKVISRGTLKSGYHSILAVLNSTVLTVALSHCAILLNHITQGFHLL